MTTPRNKANALQIAGAALAAGEPVPEPIAGWLADGLTWYLENPGSSLDDALVLRPPPGKANLTVWAQVRAANRNHTLHQLAALVDGVSWTSAQQISDWLRQMDADDGLVPAGLSTRQLYYLVALRLKHPPRSVSQLWRILRETVHLHEIPDCSQVGNGPV